MVAQGYRVTYTQAYCASQAEEVQGLWLTRENEVGGCPVGKGTGRVVIRGQDGGDAQTRHRK